MEFNMAKCIAMHVGPRNPGHVYTLYRMAGEDLEVTEEEKKDIGVTVTNDLRPNQQCRRAARTARGMLSSQIQRAFYYRDKKTFTRLYVQYVRPHVELAAQAWVPWTHWTNKSWRGCNSRQ